MDPKLKAILMKSKEIDKAARKFDTTDHRTLENSVNGRSQSGGRSQSSGGGMYDQMGITESSSSPSMLNVESEMYQEAISKSKLPPEIQRAMRENPIQQDTSSVGGISEEDKRDLMGDRYSEDDEFETLPEGRLPEPTRRPIREVSDNVSSTSKEEIRRMIVTELAKTLPKVIETYFDKKVIKENTRMMKVLLKESKNNKR